MIKTLRIRNYKSIVDLTLDLGRINVFIGENGCGKTNILEAVAMLAGAKSNRLTLEDLSNAGVRVAKPSLTFNAFLAEEDKAEINFDGIIEGSGNKFSLKSEITCSDKNDIASRWFDLGLNAKPGAYDTPEIRESNEELIKYRKYLIAQMPKFELTDYLIYNLQTQALRGLTQLSKKIPLGIFGERLDMTIAKLSKEELTQLQKYQYLVSWLDKIVLDEKDTLKFQDLRAEGNSILYFTDKFMKENALFNVENANEGVLHILFYLTLFISKKTPDFFAIDNIETALNPHLCRHIMKIICEIDNEKQALITTHNPAILDGMNLMDDNIRLFTVRRNKKGYTQVDRVQFRKGTDTKKYKLSEMWMNGMLGAIPQNF